MRQRLFRGLFGLAVYLTAVVVCPGLHLVQHARADHVHVELATGSDLLALGLDDAAATPAVDCTLAAFTLADCDTPAHGTRHFGDPAPARPQPHAGAPDPRHGAGALEHLGASLLAARAFVLSPPRCPEALLPLIPRPRLVSVDVRTTHDPRGPPAAKVY